MQKQAKYWQNSNSATSMHVNWRNQDHALRGGTRVLRQSDCQRLAGKHAKDLDQIEKRLNRKLSDGVFDERVIAVGKEVDMSHNTSPADMDYVGSFEQMGDAILAIQGIGKAFVGLTENMTYDSNAAAHQMAMTVVQSERIPSWHRVHITCERPGGLCILV